MDGATIVMKKATYFRNGWYMLGWARDFRAGSAVPSRLRAVATEGASPVLAWWAE
jgi:hypothetical protein